MENIENVISKVKKLMNIANDPNASKNEVFVAVKNAHKLMARYNIETKDIEDQTDDVITLTLNITPTFMKPVIRVISHEFRCRFLYITRRNRFIPKIYGLKNDVEVVKSVYENIENFINKELPKYVKEYKKRQGTDFDSIITGYIPCDARILKKSYCFRFANRLDEYFDKSKIELKEEFSKYELINLEVPKVVEDYVNDVVKPRVVKFKNDNNLSANAYRAGVYACDKFNVEDNKQ